jgi:phosphohistidine phosphatase
MVDRPGGRRLVLLRHAKAEPSGDLPDVLRPLSLDGRRQCGDVGRQLAATGILPERVLVSSAVRTRQTWELVRAAIGDVPAPDVVISDELYDAGPQELLAMVRRTDERMAGLLVVGHEPTMSATAAMLANPSIPVPQTTSLARLPTAGYAVLEVSTWAEVEPATLRLVDVVRPQR